MQHLSSPATYIADRLGRDLVASDHLKDVLRFPRRLVSVPQRVLLQVFTTRVQVSRSHCLPRGGGIASGRFLVTEVCCVSSTNPMRRSDYCGPFTIERGGMRLAQSKGVAPKGYRTLAALLPLKVRFRDSGRRRD